MNPLLNKEYFIPDSEAHVMPDGRLYIYGSMDLLETDYYCSHQYRVFSCGDENLENWTDHGISFDNSLEAGSVPWAKGAMLYAPDAIYKNGKYYLYFCTEGAYEGVAVSDKPYGPFTDAKPISIANGDGIDPAVFVDDDGSVYYFWGQFSLKGAKLNDDMCTIDEATIKQAILTEQEHGFHEGSSIRKANGKYYLVFTDITRGKATCLSYAMSDKPLGPYKKMGTIIDNIYCDPSTWNNHGSIECYKGKWFIFYHTTTQNRINKRRACAEQIFFNKDGTINEVEMTTSGASSSIDARESIAASSACRLKGNVYKKTVINNNISQEILDNCGGGNWTFDWAEFKYLDFGDGMKTCTINIYGTGQIQLMTSGGFICGKCDINSDSFIEYTFEVSGLSGVRPIWFLFNGNKIKFSSFSFS